MGTASLGGSTQLSMPKSELTLPLYYLLTPHLWPPGPRPMAHLDPPSPFPFPREPVLPSACLSSSHPPLFPSACGKVQALTLHEGPGYGDSPAGVSTFLPCDPNSAPTLGVSLPGAWITLMPCSKPPWSPTSLSVRHPGPSWHASLAVYPLPHPNPSHLLSARCPGLSHAAATPA